MVSITKLHAVAGRLFAPLLPHLQNAGHRFTCRKLRDEDWVATGIFRVLEDLHSGCGFIQELELRQQGALRKSHYFGSLASARRLRHLRAVLGGFLLEASQTALRENPGAGICEQLAGFHLYAGDGHFHAASSHDKRDNKGNKNATGHLHALNLRSGMLSHLALSSDGSRKKPHDMGALKRMDIEALRQGAPPGQKVLYIWDRAGIDFRRWYRWKQGSGIYFLSRTKENMELETIGINPFDAGDPVNAGILADELVSTSVGVMLRRVTLLVPETGEPMEFLTNLGTDIAPGVIAQLYFMRWRIEKSFDELKNKLHETKAWAKSNTAKRMQAAFTVLAYNLARLLHLAIQREENIADHASAKKRAKRLSQLAGDLKLAGRAMPALRRRLQEPSQLCVKYYRWLRHHLNEPTPYEQALEQLRTLYADF